MNAEETVPAKNQIENSDKKMQLNRRIFKNKKRVGTALITGASSGIGEEFCWQLAAKYHNLILVARSKEKLESLAEKISQTMGVKTEVLVADLAVDEDITRVENRLKDKDNPVDLLVNNAGFAVGQPFVGGEIDRELYALKVLVEATMRLNHAAVNAMSERNRGAIINVASIAAFTAMGTYASAKSWLVTFTKSLATEVQGRGIYLTAVCPGLVRTKFHDLPSIKDARWADFLWCKTSEVVTEALNAVNRNKIICVPNWKYKALYYVLKFAPESIVRKYAGHSASSNAQF